MMITLEWVGALETGGMVEKGCLGEESAPTREEETSEAEVRIAEADAINTEDGLFLFLLFFLLLLRL